MAKIIITDKVRANKTLIQIGNSTGITIPKLLLKILQWNKGDIMMLSYSMENPQEIIIQNITKLNQINNLNNEIKE